MTMKATQAMKMNITFWNSPMPKRANVKGMTAATGMLRPMITSGPKKALIRRKQPQSDAQRHADGHAKANPSTTRLQADQRVAGQLPIEPQAGEGWNVAAGLGSISGPTIGGRFSSPAVRHHHSPRQTTTQRTPIATACQAGISARRTLKRRGRRGAAAAARGGRRVSLQLSRVLPLGFFRFFGRVAPDCEASAGPPLLQSFPFMVAGPAPDLVPPRLSCAF